MNFVFLLLFYYVNADCSKFGGKCTACTTTSCTACSTGYFVSNKYCASCTVYGYNCTACTTTGCKTCTSNILVDGRCYSLKEYKSCYYFDSTKCTSCYAGYYFSKWSV